MSTNKLIRRARRELTANPKKTAVLGLLAAVALFFWAPLVWGWIAPAKPPAPGDTASAGNPPPGMTTSVATQQTPSQTEPVPTHTWQQIVHWRKQDPRMTPVTDVGSRRDPFQMGKSKLAEAEAEIAKQRAQQQAAATPVLSPEDLGLKVSGTIVGSRRSVAMINGRAYSQGDTIELTKNGQAFLLTLVEVRPSRIVLHCKDQQMELAIPERQNKGRFELLGSH